VVAAGMHAAGNGGDPGLAALLGDRQGIHVGAQADTGTSAAAALHDADDAGAPDSLDHLVAAEVAQPACDLRGRPVDVVEKLGVAVEIAPPVGDLVVLFGEAVDDRHAASGCRADRIPVVAGGCHGRGGMIARATCATRARHVDAWAWFAGAMRRKLTAAAFGLAVLASVAAPQPDAAKEAATGPYLLADAESGQVLAEADALSTW